MAKGHGNRENQDRVACRVWPYIFDERRRDDFVPDRERYASQKGKAHFDIHSFEPVSAGGRETRKPLKIPEVYRDWIVEFHSNLSIEQLAQRGETFSVPLSRVYIPLDTANPFHKEEMELPGKKKSKTQEPARIDIEKLLGRRSSGPTPMAGWWPTCCISVSWTPTMRINSTTSSST